MRITSRLKQTHTHLRKAQGCGAAWHDGHLEQRLRKLQEPTDHRVAGLVVCDCAALLRADHLQQRAWQGVFESFQPEI